MRRSALLHDDLRRNCNVEALSICDIYSLDRADLERVFEIDPARLPARVRPPARPCARLPAHRLVRAFPPVAFRAEPPR